MPLVITLVTTLMITFVLMLMLVFPRMLPVVAVVLLLLPPLPATPFGAAASALVFIGGLVHRRIALHVNVGRRDIGPGL